MGSMSSHLLSLSPSSLDLSSLTSLPQSVSRYHILLLLASYISYRLLSRYTASAHARSSLARARAIKSARYATELATLRTALESTEAERRDCEKDIVLSEATVLVNKMENGTHSARVVLHSILNRLIAAQDQFNVLSETNFVQALDDAERADKHLALTGRPIGRLHGLPISLKDSVNLAGIDSTLGLVRFSGVPAPKDALVVQLLKAQGAIFYAKSNIPQTLLSFECSNPLHGRSLSTYNKNLTPGGSSGGESAMLSVGASVLGLGTDIGGSVRIPAHFSGNTALKPTSRRISLQGFRASVPGQEAVPGVAGPMAQRVGDLVLMLNEVIVPAAWARDADLVPLPFDVDEVNNNAKLNVGYYVDDGFIHASPACARAVLEAVAALRADGHKVTEFKPPRILDCMALYYSLMTSDNASTISAQLDGEVWEEYCRTLITGVRLPVAAKKIVSYLLRNAMNDGQAATMALASRERTVAELWVLQAARKAYRQEFFDEWTQQGGFDVILTPVHVLPAVAHGTFKKISFTCSYTLVFNVLDLPAGVLPITFADAARDAYTTTASGLLERTARSCYDLKQQHGLPIGVQVVAKPFKDETALRAMRIIEGLVNFRPRPKMTEF